METIQQPTWSEELAQDFTPWCERQVFTPEVVAASALLQKAFDLQLIGLYNGLGFDVKLREPKSAPVLSEELGFVETAHIAVEAVLRRLAERSGLVLFCEGAQTFQSQGPGRDTTGELAEIRGRMIALDARYAVAFDFVAFGEEHFVRALRDEPDFMDRVLSGRDQRYFQLWHDATNADPLQDLHGAMGARAIQQLFPGGRILEIGGGTGNGTRHLLKLLAERNELGKIAEYVFSDVSLSFITGTRREMRASYPQVHMSWRALDINKPFESQGHAQESVSLVFGVNAAHIARDVVAMLRDCYRVLQPGGSLVFAERARINAHEMAPRELALNLCEYHRTAAIRNPDYRPAHAYLTTEGWLRALELAGFEQRLVLPNLHELAKRFPDPYAVVVVAKK